MVTAALLSCQVSGCQESVPPALVQESLCLDHYIEQAFARLQGAVELCRQGQPVDPRTVDWLLGDADFAVQSLSQKDNTHTRAQHNKLLELLLCLANLQEYLRHHSVEVKRAD